MAYIDGHAVGINSAMVSFLHEWQRGNKGEERGTGPLDEAGVRRSCHQKKKEGEGRGNEGGVRYRERRCGVESRPDARKRKSAQCTRTASAAQCCGHARKGS